ncbi:hypothetical protein BDW02DRAFT_23041 [Decorospora gaudefroyi]|uniref:Uncharacterized protein n=1 Tax=Decorospora gaudefroyi TaxID=184978 RepID=A0A6A5K4E6_9PLEO|nr:hypothetical protein BDW02DRAFT_23041 [Decorospora gaudefroyi]
MWARRLRSRRCRVTEIVEDLRLITIVSERRHILGHIKGGPLLHACPHQISRSWQRTCTGNWRLKNMKCGRIAKIVIRVSRHFRVLVRAYCVEERCGVEATLDPKWLETKPASFSPLKHLHLLLFQASPLVRTQSSPVLRTHARHAIKHP